MERHSNARPTVLLKLVCITALAHIHGVLARPLVRNIRTDREFQRLLKHHKEVTGLPVIVDYFSHGCGPCRMIAPRFKALAKQYKGKAVFAKVDVDRNRETSSRQQIRSMPTFQAYLLGKKRRQFSGADEHSLRQITQQLSAEAAKYDVLMTLEDVKNYYTSLGDKTPYANDEAKLAAQAEKIMAKAGDGGPGQYKMIQRLKKKYSSAPNFVKRSSQAKSGADTQPKRTERRAPSSHPAKPNLHLAKMEELLAEIEKRRELEEEKRQEESEGEGEDDDEDPLSKLPKYADDGSGFPERVVIVGAGPAGLAAAVYAARAGLTPVVVAPPEGGQLQGKGVLVENFPGISGVTGPIIVNDMLKQAAHFGTRFHHELALGVDTSVRPFRIETTTMNISTHALILATGANSRWLGVEGEYTFRGGGVSTCATCDGFLFRDQPVIVVGGGDTAMEDALVLARTAASVTVVHRRDTFRASHILATRVKEHASISIRWNSTLVKFSGTNTSEGEPILSHVHIRDGNTGDIEKVSASGAFIAIGHEPNTQFVKGDAVRKDAAGYLWTTPYSSKTSIEGLFAAGDVADKVYRQAITSAGSGAMAALDAERWLSEHGIKDERKEAEAALMAELMEEFQNSPRRGEL